MLRLFAGLKDSAGTSRADVEGSTVGEVIDAAVVRFGPAFAAGLERSRIWVNGEEADRGDPVQAGDEIALLPPVSGGAGTVTAGVQPGALVLAFFGVVLVAAHVYGSDAWFAAAVAGVVAIWSIDIAFVMAGRGDEMPVIPIFVTILTAVVSTGKLGNAGLAITAAVAVVAPMAWGVAAETARTLQIIAPAAVVSLLAGTAVASMLLVTIQDSQALPEHSVAMFLVVAIAATLVTGLTERLQNLPLGDPFTAPSLITIAVVLVMSAVWKLPLATFLFVSILLAIGLIAGRAFGSVLRTRSTSLIDRPPGLVWAMDGAVVAATLYHTILRVLT
jgi:molybdopterin converting factor small subunit